MRNLAPGQIPHRAFLVAAQRTNWDRDLTFRGGRQTAPASALPRFAAIPPTPSGFMWAFPGDDWHFRLRNRGGSLKGAPFLATCFVISFHRPECYILGLLDAESVHWPAVSVPFSYMRSQHRHNAPVY